MIKNQMIITDTNSLSGVGLHSGKESRIAAFLDSKIYESVYFNKIVFSPSELNGDFVEIHPMDVVDTSYSTVMGMFGKKHDNRVATIEHLMAALWAFNIQKGFIIHTEEEIPIMDGSARPFVEYLYHTLKRTANKPTTNPAYRVKETILVQHGDSYLSIEPADRFSVDITIDFPYPSIGVQNYSELNLTPQKFISEISHCRTFAHLNEITHLKMAGKALGGSFDNAIVVDDTRVLNPTGLRDPREFVKHKTLDLIGDLFTLGVPLIGHITGYKPGHKINNMLARAIYRKIINEQDELIHDEVFV